MYYVTIALLLVDIVLLAIGYRKNNRNMLATSSIVLLLSGSLESMAPGFLDGATESVAATPSTHAH